MVSSLPPIITTTPAGYGKRSLSVPSSYTPGQSLSVPGLKRKQERQLIMPWDVPGKRKIPYYVVMFHGRRGDGKSYAMTGMARRIQQENFSLGNFRHKIYANYRVDFATMCHPRIVDAITTFPEWLHDCVILIDEIAVYFPGMRATSRAALDFATFLQEIRKVRVELIFTTQFPTQVMGNLSIQVDWFVQPYLYNWVYQPSKHGDYVADSAELRWVNWWGGETGDPIYIKHRWPPRYEDAVRVTHYHNLRHTAPMFNTEEIIPAFWSPNRQEVLSRQDAWKEEMQAELDREKTDLAESPPEVIQQARRDPRTIGELLASIDADEVQLRQILSTAKRLDPSIKGYGDLVETLRRHHWACFRETVSNAWVGQRLKSE